MAIEELVKSTSDRITNAATVNAVFGEPRIMGDKALIPVAMVAGGFGAGGGSEGKMPTEGDGHREGFGGGGGGGFAARPLAVLEVTPERTILIPVIDVTRVTLAAMGLLGAAIWAITKMMSKRDRRRF